MSPMTLPVVAIIGGIALLVWSAERFIDGAVGLARHLNVPPLVIGMVIVGFGTSAPELVVSGYAAWSGTVELALGNAFGSNISNIGLILGLSALVRPLTVHSTVLRKQLPLLTLVTCLAGFELLDGELSAVDAWVLLAVFAVLMGWTVWEGLTGRGDPLGGEVAEEMARHPVSLHRAGVMLAYGLVLLVVSSRILVWGAIRVALAFGVSELLVGLTIVALGTSLPELASSIAASRRGEDDLAVGNVIGSNLFNTLAVVGLAGVIRPAAVDPEVVARDIPVMGALTLSLFLFGYGFRGIGRVNRIEASILVLAYLAYTTWLVLGETGRFGG